MRSLIPALPVRALQAFARRVTLAIPVTLAAIAGSSGGTLAAEPIRIGSFLDVTGPASFLGDPELKTLEMYVEKINAEGGVLGRPVELIHYDVANDTKKAVTFVKRLIHQDRADILVGGSTTGATMAVIPTVEEEGIPFISLAGAAAITEPVKRWVFKTPHTDRLAIRRIFEDMKARGLTTIGVLTGSGGFDLSCRENVLALAPGAGIKIAADETHGKGDTDMTPQLTKIRNAPGVDSFLYCGFGAPTAIVAKNVRQLGLTLPHYQTHGSASMKFIEGAEGAAEGVRLPAAALLIAEQLPADHPQRAVALAYRQAYEGRFKDTISTFGGHAYDGLYLALAAIQRAGGTDREAVRSEIEKTNRFIGVDGIYTMSATDHLGLDTDSFVMVEVRNGGWALLQ